MYIFLRSNQPLALELAAHPPRAQVRGVAREGGAKANPLPQASTDEYI